MSKFLLVVWLLGLSANLHSETVHLLQTKFMAGQHYFEGEESGLAGLIDVLYSPTVILGSRLKLIGIYQGTYRGTKEVADLIGGGTLFRELMDSRLGGRLVYQISEKWALKPMAGFKTELLKETRDETWTNGLFDYHKADGGLEVEYRWNKNRAARLAYNYFGLWFPNYESLESKSDLGRELAGRKILDNTNHMASLALEFPAPSDVSVELGAMGMSRNYSDQRVLEASGNFSQTKRQDSVIGASLNFRRPYAIGRDSGIILSAGIEGSTMDSNQNHMDAAAAKFLPNYYDYEELRPSIGASWIWDTNRPAARMFSVSFWYLDRTYKDRLAQEADATYLTDNIRLTGSGMTASLVLPIGRRGMAVRASLAAVNQDSNMLYEAVYRYNFSSFNYLMGFSWELQ